MTIKDLLTTFREKFKIVSVGVGEGADADVLQITHSDGRREIASNLDYMESFLQENIEKMVREALPNKKLINTGMAGWGQDTQNRINMSYNKAIDDIINHLGIK